MATQTLVSLRVGHLQIIQGIITRMAGNSAAVKNACITLNAALLAIYIQNPSTLVVIVVVFALLMFAYLDAKYLALERSYRLVYDEVSKRSIDDATNVFVGITKTSHRSTVGALASWAIWSFYLPILIGILALSFSKAIT
jgi:hypothetical protein